MTRRDPLRTELMAEQHRLVHELEVHQIELEMQNAELREAQETSQRLLERFTDLFEFAPVGYFTLNGSGMIQEANLTVTALLGLDRSRLVRQDLARFVAPTSQSAYSDFLGQLLGKPGKACLEAQLLRHDQTALWVSLHGTSSVPGGGRQAWYRVAVTDISPIKQAADAQRDMETMASRVLALQHELDASKTTGETLRRTGTKHQRLLAQSQRMQKQLRRLSRQVMTERENDRRMISHDLYAVISQALIGINLRLEHLRREAAANPGDLDSNVRSTQLMLGSSIDIVRQYSHEMGPTVLDELGLIPALEILAGRIEKKTRISLGLELSTEVEMLPLDKRLVLYRIAEEALTHASTRPAVDRIGLSIRRGAGCIRMTVRDNGRVASPTRPSRRQRSESVEIMGMKERLAMVGGVLRVTSRPTTGTTLVVRVPCG